MLPSSSATVVCSCERPGGLPLRQRVARYGRSPLTQRQPHHDPHPLGACSRQRAVTFFGWVFFFDFVRRSGTTRTMHPHGAYVRGARGNRIGPHRGEVERLTTRTRRPGVGGAPEGTRAFNEGLMAVKLISFGSPHVRRTGVHRRCGEPNETEKNPQPKGLRLLFTGSSTLSSGYRS